MLDFLKKFLSGSNEAELKKIQKIVDRINALEGQMQKLSDAEIREKVQELRGRAQGGTSLDELLPDTDVIICCLPHTPQTERMLSADRFSRMKQGAIVVNVGRGSLIDEAALVTALKSGRLFGAVLDVFEKEPLPEFSPLWDMENVLITPHISGPSFGHFPEVERIIAEICAENISRFLGGKPLLNRIDKDMGYAKR